VLPGSHLAERALVSMVRELQFEPYRTWLQTRANTIRRPSRRQRARQGRGDVGTVHYTLPGQFVCVARGGLGLTRPGVGSPLPSKLSG
jgi:hypothetical protein